MKHWSQSMAALRSVVLVLGIAGTAAAFAADKALFQVTEADEGKWNLVLNNARNLQAGVGPDGAEVEVVAFGPGIQLLKAGSPLAARIAEARAAKINVVACENTMAANKLTHADMLPDVGYVPSGVVEVMRKQQQGYAYIRP